MWFSSLFALWGAKSARTPSKRQPSAARRLTVEALELPCGTYAVTDHGITAALD